MAQVMPCSPPRAPAAVDWFDTRRDPIGTFHFRGGRQAPTTRGLILDAPGGRRFIPARPPGFAAPPWRPMARFEWLEDLAWSARRALLGQAPRRLAVLLVELDLTAHAATLHAVFDQPPNTQDDEATDALEAEVTADFADCCVVRLQRLLALPGSGPLPKGMIAYRRDQ